MATHDYNDETLGYPDVRYYNNDLDWLEHFQACYHLECIPRDLVPNGSYRFVYIDER